jgi:hypothetical protein
MNNFLVETKQEYTTQLVNILTPLIFEGIQSIYQQALENSSTDNILKNFQLFLKRIPKWNNDMITRESNRIMNNSKSYSWLEDLIKATLKANIIVLTYNPSVKSQIKVNPQFYKNININDFIHKIYIECARDLWNNPYLFYHNFPPIELKRNQRDAISSIKDCIREAIRKLLPVKHILNIYLGEDIEVASPDDDFDKCISDVEGKNLSKLIKKDLEYYEPFEFDNNEMSNKFNEEIDKEIISEINEEIDSNLNNQLNKEMNEIIKNKELNNKIINNEGINNGGINNGGINNEISNKFNEEINTKRINNEINTKGINNMKTEENTVGSQILNIINNKNIKLTDEISNNNFIKSKNNVDNKIKNILKNDLKYDSETSMINQNDFHEVFSNSSVNNNEVFKINNKNNNNNKANFLSNYLQI